MESKHDYSSKYYQVARPHFRFTLVYVLSRNRQIFISLGENNEKGEGFCAQDQLRRRQRVQLNDNQIHHAWDG